MVREYIRVFRDRLLGLNVAYNHVFDKKSIHANAVLKDLAKFCRAHHTTFLPDPRGHAVLEGRREVWLRIQEHLNLSIEEIYELHKVKEFGVKKGHDEN